MALLAQTVLILNALDNKQMIFGILINLPEAFNHINHGILLHMLQGGAVRGASASSINCLLLHRQQCISYNLTVSPTQDISTGVPRGSILGPLLFISSNNDIFNISKANSFITYADDIRLFITGTNIEYMIKFAYEILDSLYQWAKNNCLIMNPKKTNADFFYKKMK